MALEMLNTNRIKGLLMEEMTGFIWVISHMMFFVWFNKIWKLLIASRIISSSFSIGFAHGSANFSDICQPQVGGNCDSRLSIRFVAIWRSLLKQKCIFYCIIHHNRTSISIIIFQIKRKFFCLRFLLIHKCKQNQTSNKENHQ